MSKGMLDIILFHFIIFFSLIFTFFPRHPSQPNSHFGGVGNMPKMEYRRASKM